MKFALTTLSLFAVSFSAQALPSELLVQVLQTPAVQAYTAGTSVLKIEETAVYRCMNCYDLQLTLQTPVGQQLLKVRTRSGVVPGLNVTVTDITR